MGTVLLAALGIGASTVLGAAAGLLIRRVSHRFNDAVLAFAAGIMLAAAVAGLVLPSAEMGGRYGAIVTGLGVLAGGVLVSFADRFVPHLHSLAGKERRSREAGPGTSKGLLLVMAIVIHNLPEGLAVGVAAGQASAAVTLGIIAQNLPETAVAVAPLIALGMNPGRAFFIAALTGLPEMLGVFAGYFAVSAVSALLPFAMALAGGTMLYVVGDEMIPETHAHGFERAATFALLSGFVLMLLLDHYLA